MHTNLDGTPAGTASAYEIFMDWYLDTAKQSTPGYLGSMVSTHGTTCILDTTGDGIADAFTDSWTNPSDGALMTTSGSAIWLTENIFQAIVTVGATEDSQNRWGRLAFDTEGEVVGFYVLTLNPVVVLTADPNPGDALVATFTLPAHSGTWSLLDNRGADGVIDCMTNVQTPYTTTYSITWNDPTHWTAREIMDLAFGSIFDSEGRPTTVPYISRTSSVVHDIPLVWQTKGADNVVATFDLPNYISGKLIDSNGDNLPDQTVFTALSFENATEVGVLYTTVVNFSEWSSLNSGNRHLPGEVQSSTDPSFQFSGAITGDSSNPITITMPSYFMGGGNTNLVPAVDYPLLLPVTRNGIDVIPDRYTGPATAAGGAPIHFQFIGDSTGEVVIGTTYNDFINVAGGVDAVNAGTGNDVIDGGTDSNFLTGGPGTDIFFSDGRGGVTTWSTITDWQAGEQLSVWGWQPGTSRIVAWVQAGAAGYEGLTMHADLNGDGTIDTSVTFTGITSQSQLPTPLEFDGVLWFV